MHKNIIGYTVTLSQYGLGRDLNKDILYSLEPKDRRLFITNSYPYCGTDNKRELYFYTTKKQIAERLKSNLQKIVKKKSLRAGVKIYELTI